MAHPVADDDFALPVVRGGDDRAAENIAVRLTRDVFAVRELVTALEQAVANLPAALNRNGVEQGKQLAELVRKPLADARMALEKSTAAAVAANADAATVIDEVGRNIDRHANAITNALRSFQDAKGQIAEAATVSVRAQVDRYGALSTRVEERAGQVVQALQRSRIADLRELAIYAVIGVGVVAIVCVLLTVTWEVFGKGIEKPYFCVGPDYAKCYSQVDHALTYVDGIAPPVKTAPAPASAPIAANHRHRRAR